MADVTPRANIAVVGAAILENGRCLVAQRGPSMHDAGRWEFPGGKVEPGERPTQALEREIREELALHIEVGAHLGRGVADTPDRRIVLDVYLARRSGGTLQLAEHAAIRWIESADIPSLDWAPADRPVLPALARRLDQER